MKRIALTIDDGILEKVGVVAAGKRTTVNGMVHDFLTEIAGREDRQTEARKQLRLLMETSKGRLAADYKFDREETHER
jgi:ATP-dependent exoDNAse (exonuclease V) alpha subunit